MRRSGLKHTSVRLSEKQYAEASTAFRERGFASLSAFARQALTNEVRGNELHRIEERIADALGSVKQRLTRVDEQLELLYQLFLQLTPKVGSGAPVNNDCSPLVNDPNEAAYQDRIARMTRRNVGVTE